MAQILQPSVWITKIYYNKIFKNTILYVLKEENYTGLQNISMFQMKIHLLETVRKVPNILLSF